jgi:histidinol-phosphate/aromatic aminotransferase/cobyric acid decarboxylase-like protein
VLILDPTYGEYSHVIEKVVRCRVDRVRLKYENQFALDLNDFEQALEKKYDLIVLVNPNSPTGKYLSKENMIRILSQIPLTTRVWVDETYMEYVGFDQSLEQVAASSENVIVCKSMSKVYALSGARVAYLCSGQHQIEPLRTITPPWVISMPAQLAGVYALDDPSYYEARYKETHILREALSSKLSEIGLEVFPSVANFLLCKLPEGGKCAKDVVEACVLEGVYLRDVSSMGMSIGANYLRVAVKDKLDNERILNALKTAING